MAEAPSTPEQGTVTRKICRIKIELDPESGFPAGITAAYRRIVTSGADSGELPILELPLEPGSDVFKAVVGEMAQQATNALKVYQDDVQNLGKEITRLQNHIKEMKSAYDSEISQLLIRLSAFEGS